MSAGASQPLLAQLLGVHGDGSNIDNFALHTEFKGMRCAVASTSEAAAQAVQSLGVHSSTLLNGECTSSCAPFDPRMPLPHPDAILQRFSGSDGSGESAAGTGSGLGVKQPESAPQAFRYNQVVHPWRSQLFMMTQRSCLCCVVGFEQPVTFAKVSVRCWNTRQFGRCMHQEHAASRHWSRICTEMVWRTHMPSVT
jgi:hypothetical protein